MRAKAVSGKGKYVALLRAVNVGGRVLPMAALVAMFEDAGCREVATYIQSGNVIFRAGAAAAARASAEVADALATRLGVSVPVILRTAAELRAVALSNPFLAGEAEPKALHVMFLADEPTAKQIATLDPNRSPGDRFAVIGREIYLHYASGTGQTKLTLDYFEKRLGTAGTARNWRTTLALLEMAGR